MNKTDDILEKLKAARQPAIDNSDALTDLIMDNLPEQVASQETPTTKSRVILMTLRVISSVAAVYLLGLFFIVNDETSVAPDAVHPSSNTPSLCEGSTPGEIYTCYMERKRGQQTTYSLIKKKIYESQH